MHHRIVVKCSVLGEKGPGFQQPPPLLAVKWRAKVVREGRWEWGRPGVIHQSMGVGARPTRAGIPGCSRVNPGRHLYLFDPEIAHL